MHGMEGFRGAAQCGSITSFLFLMLGKTVPVVNVLFQNLERFLPEAATDIW